MSADLQQLPQTQCLPCIPSHGTALTAALQAVGAALAVPPLVDCD